MEDIYENEENYEIDAEGSQENILDEFKNQQTIIESFNLKEKYNKPIIFQENNYFTHFLSIPYYFENDEIGKSPECNTVEVSPDEMKLACGFSNGTIRILSIPSFDVIISEEKLILSSITSIKWKDNKIILVSCIGGFIYHLFLDSTNLKILHFVDEKAVVNSVDYSSDSSYFVSGGNEGEVNIYNSNLKSKVKTFAKNDFLEAKSQSNRIFCVKYHPQYHTLCCSGGWSKEVIFYDTRDSKLFYNL